MGKLRMWGLSFMMIMMQYAAFLTFTSIGMSVGGAGWLTLAWRGCSTMGIIDRWSSAQRVLLCIDSMAWDRRMSSWFRGDEKSF